MNKAKQLYEDYQKQLCELQASCPHDVLSEWMDSEWAPGHVHNFQVRVCEECSLVCSKKYHCDTCRKILIDDEVREGDGFTHPFGMNFCVDCWNKPDKYKRG